jgi:hypothetical protein
MIVNRSKILRDSESMPRLQQWKARQLWPWEGPFADQTWLPRARTRGAGSATAIARVSASPRLSPEAC